MNKPLSGIRVVELSTFVAAPVCCRLLSDLGAEVIKIEAPAGDGWRITGQTYTARFNLDQNPIFDIYNAGKKHICLNLKTPEGMDAMHRLLETADVFVTNTRPAALKRLGLDQETLMAKYPRLVYGIVLGYGEKGPMKYRVAFDTTAFFAKGGFTRDLAPLVDDYYPLNSPSGVGDTYTGYLLLGEILAALYNRNRTGKGDYVRSTLYRNAVFCMGCMNIMAQPSAGRIFPRRREWGAPGGGYETVDGDWIYAAGGTREEVAKLAECPEIADDPRFAPGEIYKHTAELHKILKEAYKKHDAAYWVQRAKECGKLLVRYLHFEDVVKDEQCLANNYVEEVHFADGSTNMMPTSPIEMASFETPATVPAPHVGTHTTEVLKTLGFDDAAVAAMLENGAAVQK